MKSLKPRQLLPFAAVLLLPIAAVLIQGRLISRYDELLADARAGADLPEIQKSIAEDIGARMLDTLDGALDDMQRTIVPLDALRPRQPASENSPLDNDASWNWPVRATYGPVRLIGIEHQGDVLWPWDSPLIGTVSWQPNLSSRRPADLAGYLGAMRANALPQFVESRFREAQLADLDDALGTYLDVLLFDSNLADDDGLPYWVFAGLAMLASPGRSTGPPATPLDETYADALVARLHAELRSDTPIRMDTLQAAQIERLIDTAESQGILTRTGTSTATMLALLDERHRDFADLAAIQRDYAAWNLTDRYWQAYQGNSLWLVGRLAIDSGSPLVLAVDVESLAERAIVTPGDFAFGVNEGFELSSRLMGLRVLVPTDSGSLIRQLQSDQLSVLPVYKVTVMLAIVLAILGGYFLWRDTKRDRLLAELRSQFVSSVTHELKTPLTAVRMFAETMQLADEAGTDSPEKRAEYLETIIHESERLSRLLNNVLAFSQIERGQRSYLMQSVALEEVVRDAARTMQFPLAEQGFTLNISVADGLPAVEADRDALEQAVLNLLSNAVKYSGTSRTVELDLSRHDSAAVIAVSDHGIGISPDDQQRIFDSFFRVTGNGNESIAGTGLGLAIVDHIARAHGGSVTVVSEPGKGSTFSIRIPLREGPDA